MGKPKHGEGKKQLESEFLFGVSLNLGIASNNYAEYVGLILAQVIFAMFRETNIAIVCDSQLVIGQVKGNMLARNIKLIELIKVAHALAFKF